MIEAHGTDGYFKADGDWMLLKRRGRRDRIVQTEQIDTIIFRPAGPFYRGSFALTVTGDDFTVRFRRRRQAEFLRLLAHLEEHTLKRVGGIT